MIDPERAREAVVQANLHFFEKGLELVFELNPSLGRMIFTLVDMRTREVVLRIPGEAILAVSRFLADEAPGALLKAYA